MSSTAATKIDPVVERKLATAFVTDLIVCRHHIQSYPESHPVVTASLRKTIESLAPLIAGGQPFTLGISRQGVLLKSEALGPEIAKIKDFAALLASLGVITISFSAELQPEEVHLLNGIFSRPRREIWEDGGVKHAFAAAGIQAVKVQAIDPSVFILTDDLMPDSNDEMADPWDIFVRKLLDGFFSVSRERLMQLMSGPPEELGMEFDAVLTEMPEEALCQTINSICEFFINLEKRQGTQRLSDDALNKIVSFIAGISPRLRRTFILNICNSARSTSGFSERLLQGLPGDALLEAMQSVATHGESIPEMVIQTMHKMSAHSVSAPALDAAITGPDGAEKVRGLLRETVLEQFIPPDYQKALMAILATDSLPDTETQHLDELRKALEKDQLEAKISEIIFEIIKIIPAAERGDGIKRNLIGLTSYYLASRDFQSLEQICRMIVDEASDTDNIVFFDPGFVQEILDAAFLLGRAYHQNIRSLIKVVGQPFVVPLMERLFAESNRSLRRLWFDCLADLGEKVRAPALERLNDGRWFVLRNLVIMLRDFSDPDVQRQIRRLVYNPHPRVRLEALKNLLCYHDPMGDNILLSDLENPDPARKLAAVQVAEMSTNPDVVRKLLAILDSGGIADYGLEIKSAVVQALAAIGDAQALPKLKGLLFSGSFLHPGKHAKLKAIIIRALPRFPTSQARPLLEQIIASGGKTLTPLAAEILKGLQGAGS